MGFAHIGAGADLGCGEITAHAGEFGADEPIIEIDIMGGEIDPQGKRGNWHL